MTNKICIIISVRQKTEVVNTKRRISCDETANRLRLPMPAILHATNQMKLIQSFDV